MPGCCVPASWTSGSACHVESVCNPPLFVFSQDGDCLAATRRPDNVHSAGGGTRGSWDRPRRVLATGEHHLGALFPRVGVNVTTLTGANLAVVRFYTRGTVEQWIQAGTEATHSIRLSCPRFRAHAVRVLLGVVPDTLGTLLRRRGLTLAIQRWSLPSLRQLLFQTGGRLIRHARYCILQLPECHLTQRLFGQMLGRIKRPTWHPT